MELKETSGRDPICSFQARIKDIFSAASQSCTLILSQNTCIKPRHPFQNTAQRVTVKSLINTDLILSLVWTFTGTKRDWTAHSALAMFMLLVFWLMQVMLVINLWKLPLVMDSRRGLRVKQWWAMETAVGERESERAAVALKQAWTRWEEGNSQTFWGPEMGLF